LAHFFLSAFDYHKIRNKNKLIVLRNLFLLALQLAESNGEKERKRERERGREKREDSR
jgi:hypothetical protein